MLYAMFHAADVSELHTKVDASPLADLDSSGYQQLRAGLVAAEQTGLRPQDFDDSLRAYLRPAFRAAQHGYMVAFLSVSAIAVVGLVATAWLVRRPEPDDEVEVEVEVVT